MGFAAEYPHSCCLTVEQAGRPEAGALAVIRVPPATATVAAALTMQEHALVHGIASHDDIVAPEGTLRPDSVMPATSSPDATAATVSAEEPAGMLPVMRMAVSVAYGTGQAGHSVGPVVLLASALYVWAAQSAHAFEDAVENLPAAHTAWKAEPNGQELPLVHAAPAPAATPAVAQKLPRGH
jgi:hypothetical protein